MSPCKFSYKIKEKFIFELKISYDDRIRRNNQNTRIAVIIETVGNQPLMDVIYWTEFQKKKSYEFRSD